MKRTSGFLTVLIVTLAATVAAQSQRPATLPAHKVKTGMDPGQVRGILGPPEKILTLLAIDEWHYCGSSGQAVVLYFDAGRVLAKVGFHPDSYNGEACPARAAGSPFSHVPRQVRDRWYSRAPRIILVTVPSLTKPVVLLDWNKNGNLLAAATTITAPPDLRDRPFFSVALFWGGQWSIDVVNHPLKPKDANQHARFYPATGSAAALLVFDDGPGRWEAEARRVGLTRLLGQAGLDILAQAGVPIR